MKFYFHLYSLLFFSFSVCAQQLNKQDSAELFYRHFTVQDGLPSNETYLSYQDKTGYIWLCTNNGISRFDGVRFKNYNNAEGLRSTVILGCREDAKGDLWLYSFSGELYRYQRQQDRFESPSFNDSLVKLLGGRAILNLVFEKDTLYVVTLNACVKVIQSKEKTSLACTEVEGQTVSARLLANGEVIVMNATEENVTRFNFEFTGPGMQQPVFIRNVPINGLVQPQLSSLLKGQNLYIVFGENLFTYNLQSKKYAIRVLPFSHIPKWTESSIGMLSGSYGKGLWAIRESADSLVYKQLIRNKNISGCLEDKQGGIWACSQTDGVYFIPNQTTRAFPNNTNEASRRVTSLFTYGDTAYYMTYSGALYTLFGKETPVQQRLIEAGQYTMRNMRPLNKNEILLFAGRVLNYSVSSGKISSISAGEICAKGSEYNKPDVFVRRSQLFLSSCTESGQNENLILTEWRYGKVFSTHVAPEGNLWLATTNDLIYMSPKQEIISEVGRKNGYHNFSVKYILPLGKDSVMVASNKGVFLVVRNEIRKKITTEQGLSSNKVLTLFILDHELWVGTSQGIDRISHYRDQNQALVVSVTGITGIARCPVTHFAKLGKYMLAGTDQGVYLFDRNQLHKTPVQVQPQISYLRVNDEKSIEISDESPDLSYRENSIAVYFHAFNFRNALFNSYRYRLVQNKETSWSLTSQNHVNFPLLSPGTYLFELQAMNPDGSWSDTTSSLVFHINKPFWQTWWFVFLLVLAGVGAAYLLFVFRLKQLQKVGDLTGKLSEVKLQALGMQINPHFVFNAIHTITSQIAAKNDSEATLKILGKLTRLMRLVFKNAQQAVIPLEQELKALNLYIELETVRLGKTFNCSMELDTINVSECKIPAMLLQPFVENAIWHGIQPLKTEGILRLVFMRVGDTLQIEIIDNGVGRRNAALAKPPGTKRRRSIDIIKERLSLLRTKYSSYTYMEITDASEGADQCGTRVLLIVPWLSDTEDWNKNKILKRIMLDDQSAYN